MKIICALFVLALASYANGQANNCKVAASAGDCLDLSTNCEMTPACSGATPQCKEVITLANWVASAVTRTCEAAGAPGCTPVTATSATGPETKCSGAATTVNPINNKGPLECYECAATAPTCTAAQTGTTPKVGGWTETNGCSECWIQATFASGTLGDVARGCTTSGTPAPPATYDTATSTGDVVKKCSNAAFCNSDAGIQTTTTTTTTTTAAPTAAPTTAPTTAAATTTAAAATTTAAAGGGSGASTIAPATFAIFLFSVIIIKMFV